jgi:hypothetical protein
MNIVQEAKEEVSGGRLTLVQGEPIQPLEGGLNSILSQKLLHEFLLLHSVKCHTSYEELTKPSLFYLLGRKSEGREQFHCYLHQNIFQGLRKRYLGINTESAE